MKTRGLIDIAELSTAEIDAMMDSSFGGNSFDHMFINQKLTQLGDKHWKAGNKTAAELFYGFSLNYLSNHESTVSGTLSRLAYFAKSHLTQDSSCADISESLGKAKAHSDRFFDFFPNPATTSTHAKSALFQPVGWYFSYFPKMLEYYNYDALVDEANKMIAVLRNYMGETATIEIPEKEVVLKEKLGKAIAAANKKVASYKWVTHYAMTTEDLPLTSTQKVKHHIIRQNLIDGKYPDRHE